MARLRFIEAQITEIEREREARLEQAPDEKAAGTIRTLSRMVGVGVETADMLTHEIMMQDLRDRRAGNARVRRGLVQMAWRFLVFQKESALVKWPAWR